MGSRRAVLVRRASCEEEEGVEIFFIPFLVLERGTSRHGGHGNWGFVAAEWLARARRRQRKGTAHATKCKTERVETTRTEPFRGASSLALPFGKGAYWPSRGERRSRTAVATLF